MKLFVTLIFFCLSFSANAATSFRLLSFNIKGLPPLAAPGWNQERFAEIGRILAKRQAEGTAPDVVLLQEVFTKKAQELISAAGYPYVAQGPTRDGINEDGSAFQKIYSSGIFILSKYPIEQSGLINYGQKICGTWDCYANKGIQFIKIRVPGALKPVTIFNTHMQAEKDQDDVRIEQIKTLGPFVIKNSRADESIFFGGDFNTFPSQASFGALQSTLAYQTAGQFCLSPQSSCRLLSNDNSMFLNHSVDHIFFDTGVVPVTIQRNFDELFKDQNLSDHLGYEAEFLIP